MNTRDGVSLESVIPIRGRYYGKNCRVCFSGVNLKTCSSCRTVSYCSKQHQSIDWQDHRELCKILSKVNCKIKYEVGCSFEEWTNYREALEKELKSHLNKSELSYYELELCNFPCVCAICYSKANLSSCTKCEAVMYCGEEHQQLDSEAHKRHCDLLKTCKEFDISFFKQHLRLLPHVPSDIPDSVKMLPKSLREFVSLIQTKYNGRGDIESLVDYTLIADSIAPCVTILYVLEKLRFIKQRFHVARKNIMVKLFPERAIARMITFNGIPQRSMGNTVLVIHFVGANKFELELLLQMVQYLEGWKGWILNVDYLEIVLVGEDLITPLKTRSIPDSLEMQSNIQIYPTTYKDVVEDLIKPDIVVGFQADQNFDKNGLKGVGALQDLLKFKKVPLILTGYEKDKLIQIADEIKTINNVRTKLEVQLNPFRNGRPFRIWKKPTMSTYVRNQYLTVFMKE